jgi:predicted DNA-binding transcriptional regulator YafY
MLKLFYGGERFSLSLLAHYFGVSERTIRRDLKHLETIVPLHRNKEGWQLDFAGLHHDRTDRLSCELLHSFASNADLEVPFFDITAPSQNRVTFAIDYHDLPRELGNSIVEAFERNVQCQMRYTKADKNSSIRTVDPIRLFSDKGIWYLIARDYKDDGVKYFRLDRIREFRLLEHPTTLTEEMVAEANDKRHIWHTGGKTHTVHLYIKPEAAEYFHTQKLLHPTQTVTNRHEDGGLEIACAITHKLELLPAIKSWIPHIFILSPSWLWDELSKDLRHYTHEDQQINSAL